MSTCHPILVCDTIFYLNLSRPALPVSFGPANALSNGHGFQIEHLSLFQCLIWFIPHPHLFLYGIYYVYCLLIVTSPSFWLHLKLHNTITSSIVMTLGHPLIQITYFGQSLFRSGLKDRYSDYPTNSIVNVLLLLITSFGIGFTSDDQLCRAYIWEKDKTLCSNDFQYFNLVIQTCSIFVLGLDLGWCGKEACGAVTC